MNDNIDYICALSPTQAEMLYHTLREPQSAMWTVQYAVTLAGDVDTDALNRAWQATVQRHPILRTAFFWERMQKPLQVAYRSIAFQVDIREEPSGRGLEDVARTDREKEFDLSGAPVMRISVIRQSEHRYALILTFHHIVLDGWSLGVVLNDAMAAYQAIRDGRELRLPPSAPYREYIGWLHRQDLSGAEAYWRRVLSGVRPPAPPPVAADDGTRGQEADFRREERRLAPAVTERLAAVAKAHRLALNTVVVAAWAIVLARWSGQDEVVLGITMSTRPAALPLVKERVGVFINTLPLRLQVPSRTSFPEWLATVQGQFAELQEHSHTPLDRIRAWTRLAPHAPVFDSHLVFENYPFNPRSLRFAPGVDMIGAQSFEQTHYPLSVIVDPGRELHIRMQYQQSRFAPGPMQRLLAAYGGALESIAAVPELPVAEVGCLSGAELPDVTSGAELHHVTRR